MKTIPLPGLIEMDKVTTEFKKGVLTIALPKSSAATAASKRISMKTE
jgi:HSP20 family molecular chaperone IbpA